MPCHDMSFVNNCIGYRALCLECETSYSHALSVNSYFVSLARGREKKRLASSSHNLRQWPVHTSTIALQNLSWGGPHRSAAELSVITGGDRPLPDLCSALLQSPVLRYRKKTLEPRSVSTQMKGDCKTDQMDREATLKDNESQADAQCFSADRQELTLHRESRIAKVDPISVENSKHKDLHADEDRACGEKSPVHPRPVHAAERRPPFKVGRRLCINWALVMMTSTTIGLSLAITTPTQYEYLITAKVPARAMDNDDNVTSTDCPISAGGLGGTEADFGLSVSLVGAGGLIGALLSAVLSAFLPLYSLFVSAYIVLIAGYSFYAAATIPVFAQVGRFLAGMHVAAHAVLFRTYLSESAEYVARRQGKDIDKVKAPLVSGAFVCHHLGSLVAPGVSIIITQVPSINHFKAPSWMFVAYASILAGFFVFGFKESASQPPTDRSLLHFKLNLLKLVNFFCDKTGNYEIRSARSLKASRSRKKQKPLANRLAWIACVLAAVFAAGVNHLCFTVIDTLLNPIMSDIFGLSVDYQSYVFTALFLAVFVGAIAALVIQKCGFSAWRTAFLGFLLGSIGLTVLMDWQAIGTDSCREYSITNKNKITAIQECLLAQQCNSDGMNMEGWTVNETCPIVLSAFYRSMNACLQVVATNRSCYWNPMSLITGQRCSTCIPLCRSKEGSLHGVQFIIGVLLMMLAIPLQKISLVMLVTWLFRDKPQGFILGLQVCAMSVLYMATAPILAKVYFQSGYHTYTAMAIPASMSLAVLLGLIAYNSLKHSALKFIMPAAEDVLDENGSSIRDAEWMDSINYLHKESKYSDAVSCVSSV